MHHMIDTMWGFTLYWNNEWCGIEIQFWMLLNQPIDTIDREPVAADKQEPLVEVLVSQDIEFYLNILI